MKALVGAFNQEKALVGAFSMIVQPVVEPMQHYTALLPGALAAGQPLHLAALAAAAHPPEPRILEGRVAGGVATQPLAPRTSHTHTPAPASPPGRQ